jgi:hypothetical protein
MCVRVRSAASYLTPRFQCWISIGPFTDMARRIPFICLHEKGFASREDVSHDSPKTHHTPTPIGPPQMMPFAAIVHGRPLYRRRSAVITSPRRRTRAGSPLSMPRFKPLDILPSFRQRPVTVFFVKVLTDRVRKTLCVTRAIIVMALSFDCTASAVPLRRAVTTRIFGRGRRPSSAYYLIKKRSSFSARTNNFLPNRRSGTRHASTRPCFSPFFPYPFLS